MSLAKNAMLKCRRMTKPLYDTPRSVQETIPIYKIAEDGVFLLENRPDGENKLFDKAYLFLDTNYSLKSDMEKESFLKIYCQFLNSMNVSFKICIMNLNRDMKQMRRDIFIHNESDPDYQPLIKEANANIQNSIKEGRNGIEQVKLFIITCERQSIDHARDFFRTIEANIKTNFKRLGSTLLPLKAEDRLKYLHHFYRLGHEGEFHFDFTEAVRRKLDWRDQICNMAIRHYSDAEGRFDGITLQYDDWYIRVLCMADLPNSISDDFIKQITSVSFNTITTLDVAPIPSEVAIKRLYDLYMANGRSIEKQQEQRNKARAYSSDISYEKRKEREEIEEYLDLMTENDEKLFYFGGYIVAAGRTMEELEAHVLALTTSASNLSVRLEPVWWDQMNAFQTALPVGVRFCDIMRPLFTQPLCAFVPFNVKELYHEGGLFYGINEISKNILIGDRMKLLNPHGFVLGGSGAGKGMDVKAEMNQVLLRGKDDVIVIDPQNEYVPLAKSFKGQFIDVQAASDNSINPMDVGTRENFSTEDAFISDKTELMLGIAEQILQHEITMGQKSIVGRCTKIVYERYFSQEREGKKAIPSPTMKEFYQVLQEQPEEEAKDLKLAFELFVEGASNFFSKPTNVNMSNRFLMYGMNDLGTDLASVGQLVILESIRARIAENFKKGIVTWLYIDEFHNLTKSEFSLRFLVKIWKEVRKLGGICTGITQNIIDILENDEVQKMLGNSQYISFLNMGDNEIAMLREVLSFNDELIEYIRGADAGCGVLKFGDGVFIPRSNKIPVDTKLYKIFSTNFSEKKEKVRRKTLAKEWAKIPNRRQKEEMQIEKNRMEANGD